MVVQADDGRVVEHNDAACELLEMTSDQLLGRSSVSPEWHAVTADLEPLDGSDHPAMRSLRSGEVVRGAVMGVRSGAGRYRWLRVDSVPFDVDGAQWVVSNFVDVTAELESLTQLTAAIDRLQTHVAPGELPQIAGVLAERRYRPVVSGLKIGGDVCDVVSIGPGRLGFLVGDVAGHDLDTIATRSRRRPSRTRHSGRRHGICDSLIGCSCGWTPPSRPRRAHGSARPSPARSRSATTP